MNLIDEFKNLKQSILPEGRVVLFGSRSRGDFSKTSDYDLLILMQKSTGSFSSDFDKFGWPFIQQGMNYGQDVGVHIYSMEEWESYRNKSLFYYNVSKEGVEL